MSDREVRRIEVLNEVQSGRQTLAAAASVLGVSERQAYRLLARYQENGGFGLVHKARGLMQLRFVPSESTESYFAALRGYLHEHGCPVAFYSDKHSVFRVTRQDTKGGQGMTQFGRALSELNIEILCANSSQAKGRVERANRTLQDRLVKELRLAGASSMEAGNAFLPMFVERYNERFAVPPIRAQDVHRPLRTTPPRLNDILCHREQRYVGAQLTCHYDRKQIILEQTDVAKGLEGQYVELFDYWDKPLEVRWRGHVFPYRVFSKDQRVSHTAIVENKRLGHALAVVKAQQDLKLETKVMTNSEKTGYRKNPRATYGPKFIEKTRSRAAVQMTVRWKAWNDQAVPLFPQTLETAKERRFPHYAPRETEAVLQ